VGKGKEWEKKLVRQFDGYPVTAERVPRSVADAQPVDDVLVARAEADLVDHPHRPITRALAEEQIGKDEYEQLECKYTSGREYGINGLYSLHLETVGLGTTSVVWWPDSGVYSGGISAFVAWLQWDDVECWEHDDTLSKSTRKLFGGRYRGCALRGTGKPWVLVWEVDHG